MVVYYKSSAALASRLRWTRYEDSGQWTRACEDVKKDPAKILQGANHRYSVLFLYVHLKNFVDKSIPIF